MSWCDAKKQAHSWLQACKIVVQFPAPALKIYAFTHYLLCYLSGSQKQYDHAAMQTCANFVTVLVYLDEQGEGA